MFLFHCLTSNTFCLHAESLEVYLAWSAQPRRGYREGAGKGIFIFIFMLIASSCVRDGILGGCVLVDIYRGRHWPFQLVSGINRRC